MCVPSLLWLQEKGQITTRGIKPLPEMPTTPTKAMVNACSLLVVSSFLWLQVLWLWLQGPKPSPEMPTTPTTALCAQNL